MLIPFCKTDLGFEEKEAVMAVMDSGWVAMGPKVAEFEEKFAEYVGAKHAVFVDSGTSALFLAVQYLKRKGIRHFEVPSLTFTATAEAVLHSSGTISFGDVDQNTMCLEESHAGSLPVHLLGNKAMPGALIYDSAHRIEKDDVKDSNALWCYSFYVTKNITTIDGGMIATNDFDAAMWLKSARDHGLDLGTKERYTQKYKQYDVQFIGWREKGSDFHAVVGLEQLKKLPRLTERRNELVQRYNEHLGLQRSGNHVYPILVTDREKFMQYMYDHEIQCTVHFRPLHTMTGYKNNPSVKMPGPGELPNTDYIGERIVSLPLFPRLSNREQDKIINTVLKSNLLLV